MKKILLSFAMLVGLYLPAFSQQTIPAQKVAVPATTFVLPAFPVQAATSSSQGVVQPDNVTTTVKNGILTCTDSYNTTTGALTIGGQLVTNPSFNTVNLNSGVALVPGTKYLVTLAADGVTLSYTPYVAPTTQSSILITVPIKAVTTAIPSAGLVPISASYSLTAAQIAAGIKIGSVSVTAAPGSYPGSQFAWNLFTYANANQTSGIIYITTNGPQSQMPAFNAVVTVTPAGN